MLLLTFLFGEGRNGGKSQAVQVSPALLQSLQFQSRLLFTPNKGVYRHLVIVFTAHPVPKLVGSFTSLLGTCINYCSIK